MGEPPDQTKPADRQDTRPSNAASRPARHRSLQNRTAWIFALTAALSVASLLLLGSLVFVGLLFLVAVLVVRPGPYNAWYAALPPREDSPARPSREERTAREQRAYAQVMTAMREDGKRATPTKPPAALETPLQAFARRRAFDALGPERIAGSVRGVRVEVERSSPTRIRVEAYEGAVNATAAEALQARLAGRGTNCRVSLSDGVARVEWAGTADQVDARELEEVVDAIGEVCGVEERGAYR